MKKEIKYYFETEDSEICYTESYFISKLKESGNSEIDVFEAKPIRVGGMFWCNEYCELTEDGSCGKKCAGYEPKNKVRGKCINRSNTLYEKGNKITITLKSDRPE